MISAKSGHLKKLVEQSTHAEKTGIIDILKKLPALSVRNAMAHGYLRFGSDFLVIIYRDRKGKLTRLKYTTTEFEDHLKFVAHLADRLSTYLKNTDTEAREYITAVENTPP